PTGTQGLGIAPLIIIAVAVVAVLLGAAALTAITYWGDSSKRLEDASQQTESISPTATPPCSAAPRAQLQPGLALGPFDQAASNFTNVVGAGISDTIKYIGIAVGGVAVAGVGYFWWKHRSRS